MTSSFEAFKKASSIKVFSSIPSLFAISLKASLLYQPGVAVLLSVAGFSKETPIVFAPRP